MTPPTPLFDTPCRLRFISDITKLIEPPAILRHLVNYVKNSKESPNPYQRSGLNMVECLCGEVCSGRTGSKDLSDSKSLTPEVLSHAVIAVHADVEWRRVRAIAGALRVDATQEHFMFLDLLAKSEADICQCYFGTTRNRYWSAL